MIIVVGLLGLCSVYLSCIPSHNRTTFAPVQDTVVYDPFFKDMPRYFNMEFKELLAAKHPHAWVDFECGTLTEEQLLQSFFSNGRQVDGDALKAMMVSE